MTDIVEMLRQGSLTRDDYRWKAADEITRLTARVTELEGALKLFACDCAENDLCKFPHACRNYVARAALTQPAEREAERMSNSPEIPDSSSVVHSLIPPDWGGNPYFVASELKRLLASVADHGTSIDSGTMDGQAHLWVTIGGTEYFVTVEKASGRSKSNPLVSQDRSRKHD